MTDQKQISDELLRLSQLMELAGEDSYRSGAYKRAGQALRRFEGDWPGLLEDKRLTEIDGIGDSIAHSILELAAEGNSSKGKELESEIPAGVRDLLRIRGLGPGKARTIWQKMGIESVGELYYACLENRLVEAKGFGSKTQENILHSIEFLQANEHLFLASTLLPHADRLLASLQKVLSTPIQVALTGDLRRGMPLASRIELLSGPEHYRELMLYLIRSEDYELVTAGSDLLQAKVRDTNLLIDVLFPGSNFYYELFRTTGSLAHTEEVPADPSIFYQSEEEIYTQARIQFVPPELREGKGEIRAAYRNQIPDLIQGKDLKGLLHVHTTWSDGRHSLREMAEACRDLGMHYLGVTDHSRTAVYANGLSEERIVEQHREIDALNEELAPFRILKGIESDILPNGDLDYPPLVLSSFDLVIASVHSQLRMEQEQATERLIRAIQNPFTNVLGHPTGRLLLAREGYPIDHGAVIEACAEYGVAIELNANPQRLDLDWNWIRFAQEKGVLISINPDAHRREALTDYRWGVRVGRKGWLRSEMTLNAKGLDQLLEFLMEKRKKRIS